MGNFVDIVGHRFGRLEVVGFCGKTKYRHSIWRCKCDCGEYVTVEKPALISGKTQSCGCLHSEQSAINGKAGLIHGMSRTPTYRAWNSLIQRCTNAANASYKDYGGRGIKVCDRWLESFENFYADMGERPEGMTLDRIDNDKGYEPDNCRWATAEQQANNRRNNRRFECDGSLLTVAQIAKQSSVNEDKLRYRLYEGMSVEQSINQLFLQGA